MTQIQIIFQDDAPYTFDAAPGYGDQFGNTVGLVNGNYFLHVNASVITDGFGKLLDAAGTGVPGSNTSWEFYRLFGDVNGDRTVNSVDAASFRAANGTSGNATPGGPVQPGYLWYLDAYVEGNIDVNNQDSYNAFLADYLETLNP